MKISAEPRTTVDSEEWFRFGPLQWDIRGAKRLVAARTADRRMPINAKTIADLFGTEPEAGPDGKMTMSLGLTSIDRERAMSDEIDPDIPIIGAMVRIREDGDAFFLVLDGHHRIWKAWSLGREGVAVHLLSPEEEVGLRTWASAKPAPSTMTPKPARRRKAKAAA